MGAGISKARFAQAFQSKKEKYYRIAYSYVKNEHDALDILSEATYRGFIHLNKLEKPEFFDTWMSRIIINCAYDLLKKQKKYEFVVPDDTFTEQPEELSIDDRLDLYQALNTLNPEEKTLIILKYFEDRSFREIAETMKLPESTVKTRLYRTIGKLKEAVSV